MEEQVSNYACKEFLKFYSRNCVPIVLFEQNRAVAANLLTFFRMLC